MPRKQPKKGRLWLNDGSRIRLRPERANHVWAHDLVEDRTRNRCGFRMLRVVDEFAREALASRWTANSARPRFSRPWLISSSAACPSTSGPAQRPRVRGPSRAGPGRGGRIQDGLHRARLTLGSTAGKDYVESLDSKLREELVNREILHPLKEA